MTYETYARYADDRQAEYVKEFIDADITLGISTIPVAMYETLFGHTVSTNAITFKSDDSSPYVGVGIIAPKMVNNEKTYEAMFIPKVKFADPSESFETKGNNITFKTPSISGKASALESGVWKYVEAFESESAAASWINSKFGVSGSTGSTGV